MKPRRRLRFSGQSADAFIRAAVSREPSRGRGRPSSEPAAGGVVPMGRLAACPTLSDFP